MSRIAHHSDPKSRNYTPENAPRQQLKHVRLNRNYGSFGLAPPVKVNYTTCQRVSLALQPNLSGTRFATLISKNRHMLESNQSTKPPNVSRNVAGNTTWTSALCELRLLTTRNRINKQIEWCSHMTDIARTSLSSMVNRAACWYSSHNPKSRHWK